MILFFKNFVIYIIAAISLYNLIKKIVEHLPLVLDMSIKKRFNIFKNDRKLINKTIYNLIKDPIINELTRRQKMEFVRNQIHPFENKTNFYNKITSDKLLDYIKTIDNNEFLNLNNIELEETPQVYHYNLKQSELLALLFLFNNYKESQYFILKYKMKNFNLFYVNRDGFNNVKYNILFKMSHLILNDPNIHFHLDSFEFKKFLERKELNDY